MTCVLRKRRSGVTVLELLITIFVLLIGMVGIMGVFPVGVRLSRRSSEDIIGAMTAEIGLAAVRCQPNLLKRVKAYSDKNTDGDVLGWDSTEGGVAGIYGTVQNVAPAGGLGPDQIEVIADPGGRDISISRKNGGDDLALMLITSGQAQWKLYRLDAGSQVSGPQFASTANGVTNFAEDGVQSGDKFRLLGASSSDHVWATVPAWFYGSGSGPPSGGYVVGQGAAKNYGYLALVSRVHDLAGAYRVDILVYKAYEKMTPPEGNRPAVGCYTTIVSESMLQ